MPAPPSRPERDAPGLGRRAQVEGCGRSRRSREESSHRVCTLCPRVAAGGGGSFVFASTGAVQARMHVSLFSPSTRCSAEPARATIILIIIIIMIPSSFSPCYAQLPSPSTPATLLPASFSPSDRAVPSVSCSNQQLRSLCLATFLVLALLAVGSVLRARERARQLEHPGASPTPRQLVTSVLGRLLSDSCHVFLCADVSAVLGAHRLHPPAPFVRAHPWMDGQQGVITRSTGAA